MAFDKNKPHGTVSGGGDLRKYEQDGVFYKADGSEYIDPKAPKKVAPAPAAAPAVAPQVAPAAVTAQLAKQG